MMRKSLYCRLMQDKMYESAGDRDFPILHRLELAFHIVFCPRCGARITRLEYARELMRTGFFPENPGSENLAGIESRIMERIALEAMDSSGEEFSPELSLRGWVVAGVITMISLGTAILGMDFVSVAALSGSSFLIPAGLTIGAVITVYGAIFIGSHLKELSERFGIDRGASL